MSKKSRNLQARLMRSDHRGLPLVNSVKISSLALHPVTAAVMAVLGSGLSVPAFAGPPTANNIVTDGRTQTQINVNGSITNITTQTVSGVDAFNSFSQFQEAAGNQVNLYLPANTENLINLVSGGPTQIDGILNSYQNGQIGGRVFFADPYGLVVGAQGLINVGALSVSAPTQQFMNQLMSADGSVDSSALSALLSGTEPLSTSGAISIQGEVHALDAVRLRAQQVDASGLIWVMGGDGTDALTGDAVNTQDATQGTALVNHGGSIEIVSGGDTDVEGSLQADGNANQSGGSITILAGQNADVAGSAALSAAGQGSNADGGEITINSGNDTSVGNGARFVASAGSSGNGGQIEVSAANDVSVGSVAFDASANSGRSGSVLFDPTDQSIINGSITTGGADFDDEDATSIEVTANGKVDTTSSSGAAGNITLGAPSISIDAGGQLIASDGAHTPGNITLDAEQDQTVGSGLASASTSITVAGTLNGGEIDITADSSGTASYSSVTDAMQTVQETLASMPADWASKLSLATDSFLASLLPVGVDIGAASASIDIQNSANIQAAGNLTIASSTDTKASMPALDAINGTPLMAAAVYGEVYGIATTTVDSGATLAVSGSNTLTVQATNSDELEVSATVNSDAQSVDITAAIGYANVNANASIASGANVNAANVVVLAHNSNSFGVDSAVTAAQGGQAGIAAAVSITNTNATAEENANLGTAAAPINSLVVDASSSTDKNTTGADTSVGGQASSTTPTEVVASGGDKLPDYLQELLGEELTKADEGADTETGSNSNSSESSTSPFKLGSAISVADSSQNANATVGANTNVYASNQIAVHSGVEDDDIANSAASEVTSSEKQNNAATLSVSAGIAVGLYSHAAAASVGNGALIVAPEIGVGSNVDIPWNLPSSLTQWDGISTLETAVSDLLQKSGSPIMTSYVDSQSDTGNVGLAGAVNYLSMQNTSTAWVSSGASLECDTSVSCTPNSQTDWSTPPVQYGTDETTGDALTDNFSWTAPIDIAADNSVQTINDAGNFKLLELNGTGGEDSSTSVGGGFDDVNYLNTTIAGVAANAVISVPAESVAVDAESSDTAITVTPTAGRGSGISANVIMAMMNVDNVTHASISNAALVTASSADVNAHEGMNVWTVAGAISQGSSAGVGAGIAVNNLGTDTQAYIGDNTCDAPGGTSSCTPAGTGGGAFKVDTLNVQALTDGQSGALAVSGAEASGSQGSESGGSGSGSSGSGGGGSGGSGNSSLSGALGFINTAAEFLGNFPALQKVSSDVTNATSSLSTLNALISKAHTTENKDSGKDTGSGSSSSSSGQQGPKFGLAVSGSGSANIAKLSTAGYVDGVTITPDQNASNNVTVNGLNNTFLISASGAGALASAKNQSSGFSGGIAGAVAFSLIQNSTNAYIDNSTLTEVQDLSVQALSGGSEVDIGLGLAVNTSSSNTSVSAAGSFSLSGVQNNTRATLSGNTVTGSGSGDAEVIAYDDTLIGAGGGSLSIGGKASLGLAVTLSDIGNLPGTTPTTPYGEEATISGGKLSGFNSLDVEGLDSSVIADGAATGSGGAKTNLALNGAFVFNNIGVDTSGSIGGDAQISGIGGKLTVAGAGVDPTGNTPDGSPVDAFTALLTGDGSPVDASLIDFSGVSLLGSSAPLGSAIYGVAGAVGAAKNTADLSFVLNNIGNSDTATLGDANVNVPGAVNVDAADNTYILGLSAGLGASTGSFAGVGSVTANLINDSVSATLGDTAAIPDTTLTAGSLDISATNGANINALAGNVAISGGGAAAGVAIGFNEIGDQTAATLTNATANTGAGITTVQSTSNGSIESAAVAGAVGDDVALSGSFSINDIGTDDLGLGTPQTYTDATVEGNGSVTAANLSVQASDSASIETLAGSISASGNAALGAAFTLDNISDDTNAEVDNSTLVISGNTGVNAASTAMIEGLSVGGAASGDLAIVGSFTDNVIDNSLDAGMSGVTMDNTGDQTGQVQVAATDQSQIQSLAGAVAVSGGAGVGVSVAVNSIGDTADAHVDGGDYTVTDLTVQALSQDPTPGTANIQTIAAGVGGGADIGGAASVAVNVLTGGTNAYIDGGANVTAADNVGVLANTQQGVDVLAGSLAIGGSAAGVGVGFVVNYLDDATNAYISGSGTQVNANASNNNDSLSIDTGVLSNPPDVNSVQSPASYVTPDLSDNTTNLQGVAVVAGTNQFVATLGVSAALSFDIGSVSLDVMGDANVIGGNTLAYINGATVNSAQQLDVGASNHSFSANIVAGVAGSGGVSGSAALNVNSFNHSTSAYILDAATSAGSVNVHANATQDEVGLTAGLAAGIGAGAGTGIINIFNDQTTAYVDQGSLTTKSGDLNVTANSSNNANLMGGAGAIGGAAIAGTLVLAVSENQTSAYVGDNSNITSLDLNDALDVQAVSATNLNSLTVSGAGAGGVGIAGMAVVSVVQNQTNAYLDNAQLNQATGEPGSGNVTVNASDTLTLTPKTGAVGVGGTAGVGAAANVALLQDQVGATIANSALNSAGNVAVTASSNKDVEPITVTAGIGATVGIGGTASLILFGPGGNGDSNTLDQLNQNGSGTLSQINSLGSQDNINDPSNTLSSSQSSQLQQDTQFSLLNSGALPGSIDGTSAVISNSSITATSTSVTATDTTHTVNLTGALAAGGVGAGAAIGYTGLNDQVTALVDSASILNTGALTVSAVEQDGNGHAAEVDAYEGSGGLVGIGAAVAIAEVNNQVSAGADGTLTGAGGGALLVSAADTSSVSTTAVGASVGIAAAGLVISTANKSSAVNATVGNAAQDTLGSKATVSGFNTVSITAGNQGSVSASATGGSGGLGVSADGANAFATENATVQAGAGINANITTGSDGVNIQASDQPDTSASALGVSIAGGIGLAESLAQATVSSQVTALDDGSIAGAGGLSINASSTPDANGDPTASTSSTGGGGGVLAGATGASSLSTDNANVLATVGSGVMLPNGNISILANNTSNQSSTATGVAGGIVAVGEVLSESDANTTTTASLGDGAQGQQPDPTTNTPARAGNLTIIASGTDNDSANATAGSGGLVSGNGAAATTNDNSKVVASVGSAAFNGSNPIPLYAGAINISAQHIDNYSANTNSVNAAVVGASGAGTTNNANVDVETDIGDPNGGADLVALGGTPDQANVVLAASDQFNGNSGAQAAGGGVLSGSAGSSSTNLSGNASININSNSTLVGGLVPVLDDQGDIISPGGISIVAGSQLSANDLVTDDTGGAITGAGTSSNLSAQLNNNVNLNSGATLFSSGNIGIGTYTQANASTEGDTHTWGAAGVGDGSATTSLNTQQNVNLDSGSLIQAFGNINLNAGEDPTGSLGTSLNAVAIGESYVRGLIAIPSASATTNLTSDSYLNVASGANVESGADVNLSANQGALSGQADGTAHGYELFIIPVTINDSNSNSSGAGVLNLNGNITAGIYHDQNILIGAPPGEQCQWSVGDVCGINGQEPLVTNMSGFNAQQFVNDLPGASSSPVIKLLASYMSTATNADGLGYDVVAAQTAAQNSAPLPAPSGVIYAAGGNISVNADQITGSSTGDLTAYGAPSINITNTSTDYLVVGNILIPQSAGGEIQFTGPASQAEAQASGIGVHSVGAGQPASVTIQNTYNACQNASANVCNGPAILLMGNIDNLGGSVTIANASGSLGQFGTINAQQITLDVPNGLLAVYLPGKFYSTAENPLEVWSPYANAPWFINSNQTNAYDAVQAASTNNGAGTTYTSNTPPASSGPTDSSLNAAEIAVQALYIDIDSPVTVGHPTNWTVNVSPAIQQWIASLPPGTQGLINIPESFNGQSLVTLTQDGITITDSSQPVVNIGNLYSAQYNTLTGQIVVPNINASGGGFALFYGGIINTNDYQGTSPCTNASSPQCGSITVNDGFGQVMVNNPTNLPVAIQDINTGYGTPGEVVFMDTLKPLANGTPLTTWYVDQQGTGVSIYTNQNGATTLAQAETGQLADQVGSVGWTPGLTSTSYTPKNGEAVQWTDQAVVQGFCWFYSSCTSSPFWSFVTNWQQNPTSSADPNLLSDGLTVTNIGASQNAAFAQTISMPIIQQNGFNATAELDVLNSVKADNPITINFVGNPSGAININSSGSVALNGNLTNPSGNTDIYANGSITQTPGAGIVSQGLFLYGSQGIGGMPIVNASGAVIGFSTPLNAQLTGGQLNAIAGSQGIDLAFDSPVTIGYVASDDSSGYGNVSISAQGNISAGSLYGLPNITGQSITLSSAQGGVGTSSAPLVLDQQAIGQAGLSTGAVNVSALNDIDLEDVGGNLVVGTIASTAGNVAVEVSDGSLLDASGTTSAQTLSASQLQGVWQALNLVGTQAQQQNVQNKSVVPFQNLVDANYQQYWQLLDNGSVNSSGQFILNDTAVTLDAFEAQAAAAGFGSDAQAAQTYANSKYQSLVQFFNTNFEVCSGTTCNNDWQNQAEFQKFDPGFSYTASAAQAAALTANGTYDNTGQLIDAVNASALRPAGGTPVGSSIPNISGNTVTLCASQGIGSLGAAVTISYSDLFNGTLSSSQVAALAAAVTPGDVSLVLNNTGTAIDNLEVTQTQPLFLQASGAVTATSQGSIYLQANGNLNIAKITGAGDVRLLANGSLLNDAAVGLPAVTTTNNGNLTLVAGSGSLGAANAPLTLNVSGALLAASAGVDINLEQLNGTLTVDHVYAIGNLTLQTPNGSLLAFGSGGGTNTALSQNSTLNLTGSSITLDAQGDIGSSNQALQLQVGGAGSTGGELDAQTGGSIYLSSPVAPDGSNVLLQVGQLTAGGSIALTTGATQVQNIGTSTGIVTLNIPGVDLVAGTLTAGGSVTVSGGGNLTLGQLNAQQNLSLQSAGNLQLISASSANGNLILNSGGTLSVTNLQATQGTLVANAFGDFNLAGNGQIISSGGQTYSAVGSFTMGADSRLTSDGAIFIAATQNITLGALNSSIAVGQALSLTAGDALAGNGDGQINLATAGGQTVLQAGSGIGFSTEPLLVNLPWLQASTTSGGIYIHDVQSLTAPNGLSAPAGNVNANIAGSFEFGNIISGDGTTLTTSAGLSGNDISSGTGGISLNDGGDVILTQTTTLGALAAQAGGNLSIGNAAAGGDLTLNAAGNIGFQQLTAGDSLSSTAGGDVLGGNVNANDNLSLSGMNITLQDASAGGNLTLQAQNALIAADLQAGGTVMVNGQDVQLDSITSGNALTLNAVNNILFQQLSASGPLNLTSSGGSIIGNTINASSADLSAFDNIQIGSLNVLDSVNLAANNISADIVQINPSTALQMYLDGVSGGQANNILVQVNADAVTLWKLDAKKAQINTSAGQFDIVQGDIADWLYLITPEAKVWMNNQNMQLADVNVQLFQPDDLFTLSQDGMHTSTNSYVISYEVPYQVQVPNYDAPHVSSYLYYGGASLVRDALLYMQGGAVPLDLGSFGTQIMDADGRVRQPHKTQPVVSTSSQGAVNVPLSAGNHK